MKPALIAVAIVLAATSLASAATAVTTSNANVRSGPSTNARVVVTLSKGTRIEVENCKAGWCELSGRNGPRGFISQSLVRIQANTPAPNSAQPQKLEPNPGGQPNNQGPNRRP